MGQREASPAAFASLLNIVRENRNAPARGIIDKVQADPESKFLAAASFLMWYPRRLCTTPNELKIPVLSQRLRLPMWSRLNFFREA